MRTTQGYIDNAIKQHCKVEQDWLLHWYQQWWFTFKFIVSVVFNIQRDLEYNNKINVVNIDFYSTRSFEYGSGADWTALLVAKEGFGYDEQSDGYP